MQLAQLDLFGVSRRFPSIRQLHRKDRKKQEKEEKKPEGRKDEGCGDADDHAVLRTMAAGSVNISAGPLYSLPAKKSANLPAQTATSENGMEAGRLAASGNGSLRETRTTRVPDSTVTPGALTGTLKEGLTAGASGGMAGSEGWAAAMAASGKFENSYMSLPAVKTTSGGGGPSRLHLFRNVNIVQSFYNQNEYDRTPLTPHAPPPPSTFLTSFIKYFIISEKQVKLRPAYAMYAKKGGLSQNRRQRISMGIFQYILFTAHVVHCKKRLSTFSVPSRDVTYQTIPGREYLSIPGQREFSQ
jgi:hypothetical protein